MHVYRCLMDALSFHLTAPLLCHIVLAMILSLVASMCHEVSSGINLEEKLGKICGNLELGDAPKRFG